MKRVLGSFALAASIALIWSPSAHAQKPVVILQGEITSNQTLTSANDYLLRGAVFVREGAALTINAGTSVFGEQASLGTLIIDRGAQIFVRGNKNRPVIMTSDQPDGERRRGDWGGLIINGRAPINVPGGEAEGEGDTGTYGGSDPNDNSGSIKFLRIEFGGIEFSPDNELNCLALQGVGSGTKLQYIQCHMNKDDGFEFFGGTAELKYAVASAIGDDSFDATEGWTGKGQYWIAWQVGDDADQGFEIDNSGENNNLLPRTSPTVSNFTLVGDDTGAFGTESDLGMLIREGAAGVWQNGVVMRFNEEGYTNTEKATFNNYKDGSLAVRSMIFQNNGAGLAGRQARADERCGADVEDITDANNANNPCAQLVTKPASQNTEIWTTFALEDSDAAISAQDQSRMVAGECCAATRGAATAPNFRFSKNSPVYDGTVTPSDVPRDKFFDKKGEQFIGAVALKKKLSKWFTKWTIWDLS